MRLWSEQGWGEAPRPRLGPPGAGRLTAARPFASVIAANELACRGLDHLEERIPALQYPPEKVSPGPFALGAPHCLQGWGASC